MILVWQWHLVLDWIGLENIFLPRFLAKNKNSYKEQEFFTRILTKTKIIDKNSYQDKKYWQELIQHSVDVMADCYKKDNIYFICTYSYWCTVW